MAHVGIVTLVGFSNYGNRLQNFALQEVVRGANLNTVQTIDSTPVGTGFAVTIKMLNRLKSEGIGSLVASARGRGVGSASKASPPCTSSLGTERQDAIRRFVHEKIDQTTADFSSLAKARRLADGYDCFIAGSDQIWNPAFGLRDHFRFLEFAKSRQRVAYAASFGAASIPKHLEKVYRSGIAALSHVSVREQRAAELVREITGRSVPVVLDPTMVLEPSVWEALAVVPPSLERGGYVAEFFLGSATTEEEMGPVLRYATRAGLERLDLKADSREDLVAMGPLEFIGAIRNANLLVTDSFHAAVFATIFSVPFLLRGRGEMDLRFDTLLSKSGIEKPKWQSLKEIEASVDIDWDAVKAHLAFERRASRAFLSSALSDFA